MTNTELKEQRRSDIQSVKDWIVPGDEYTISEIQELTKLSHPRVLHAVASLCNLDYLTFSICELAGMLVGELTTYRTL